MREDSGESSGALVVLGFASRLTAGLRGLLESVGSAMNLTRLGVGVIGGGAVVAFDRFLDGVDGDFDVDSDEALRFRPLVAGAGGGGIVSGDGLAAAWLLRRDERLVAAMTGRVMMV